MTPEEISAAADLVVAMRHGKAAEEVVRALAACPAPIDEGRGYCILCDAHEDDAHEPTCPWRRSVELVKEWDQ